MGVLEGVNRLSSAVGRYTSVCVGLVRTGGFILDRERQRERDQEGYFNPLLQSHPNQHRLPLSPGA